MAETSVLSISLKEYKKSIEDLRSSLLGLENGSEEYNKIVEEIRERQQTLNDVMRAGKAEYDSNANSLNGMKTRLSELKKEFGDLEVGTEKWKQAQSEIESLNEDIGKIEQGMGIFSRNVGNYSSAFVGAINSMGGSVGNLIPVISGLKQGFIALQKVPIVAVIAAIAMALQQLGKAFTSSNENANGLAKAFAPLKAVGDMVTRVFEGIASKLINLFAPIANIISKFAEFIAQTPSVQASFAAIGVVIDALTAVMNVLSDAMDALMDIINKVVDFVADLDIPMFSDWAKNAQNTRKEMEQIRELEESIAVRSQELAEMERANLLEKAKLQNQADELRAIIADKENKTTEQRRVAAKKWREIENKIIDLSEAELRLKLLILKQQNALSGSTDEQLKKEAEINAELIKQSGIRSQIDREYNTTNSEIASQEKSIRTTSVNSKKEAEKKKVEAAKKAMQSEIALLESQLKMVEKGSGEELRIRREIAEKRVALSEYAAKHEEMSAKELQNTLEAINNEFLSTLKGIYSDRLKAYEDYEKSVEKLQYQQIRNNVQQWREATGHLLDFEGIIYGERIDRTKKYIEEQRSSAKIMSMMSSDMYAKMLKDSSDFYTKMLKFEPFNNWLKGEGETLNSIYKDLDKFKLYVGTFFGKEFIDIDPAWVDQLRDLGYEINEVYDSFEKYSVDITDSTGATKNFAGTAMELEAVLNSLGYVFSRVEENGTTFQTVMDKNGKEVGRFALKVKYELDALPAFFEDTLDKIRKQDFSQLTNSQIEDFVKLATNVNNAENNYVEALHSLYTELANSGISELAKNQAYELAKAQYEAQSQMIQNTETYTEFQIGQIEKQIELYEMLVRTFPELVEKQTEWNTKIYELDLKRTELLNHLSDQRAEKLKWEAEMIAKYGENYKQLIDVQVSEETRGEDVFTNSAERRKYWWGELIGAHEAYRKKTEDYLERENALYDLQHMVWDKNRETYEDFLKRKEDATKRYVEAQKKLYAQDRKNIMALSTSTGDLVGAIGDAWMDSVERRAEANDANKEELKKEFERAKALQVTATIINTIAGSIGAFEQAVKTYPAPFGAIIGGVQAAAATVAGYAQVQTIKNQKLDLDNPESSGSGGGGNTVVTAAATPLLDEATDIQDLQALNVNGDSQSGEQRVYILQSDISESNKQVQVRQTNTTF